MTENEKLVRTMIDCYSAMDAAALEPLLHIEARHTAPGSDFGTDMSGRAAIATYFRDSVFPAFDRVSFEVVHLFEDAGRSAVTVEWRSHVWPKNGKHYSNTGAFIVEIKDGLIYWVREYFDTEQTHRHVS